MANSGYVWNDQYDFKIIYLSTKILLKSSGYHSNTSLIDIIFELDAKSERKEILLWIAVKSKCFCYISFISRLKENIKFTINIRKRNVRIWDHRTSKRYSTHILSIIKQHRRTIWIQNRLFNKNNKWRERKNFISVYFKLLSINNKKRCKKTRTGKKKCNYE